MNSVNEELICSYVKGEHIVALVVLGAASCNQVDTPSVNENVSSCLKGEHRGALEALG